MNLLAIITTILLAGQFDDVARLQWADPDHKPLTYQQYISSITPISPFYVKEVSHSSVSFDDRILLITNAALYQEIGSTMELSYIPHLEYDRYEVWNVVASGGTPADLRAVIEQYYKNNQIDGVFLIGDLPVPWYHLDNDYEPGNPADFPCDLCYTALDADFLDRDKDGIYDAYIGCIKPVIYLGWLVPSSVTETLGRTQAELIITYLSKDVSYRIGTNPLDDKALCYVDDFWASSAPDWSSCIKMVYRDTDTESDPYTTWADDYLSRLGENYEHILIAAHSSPILHRFFRPGGTFTNVLYSDIDVNEPKAHFYNLFACSSCNFLETNCLGSHYLFHLGNNGLIAIGSTKLGSMMAFEYFYRPLSKGCSWGDALRQWSDKVVKTKPCWFYGMTCLGDPTLKISRFHTFEYEASLMAEQTNADVKLNWWSYSGGQMLYDLYRGEGDLDVSTVNLSDLSKLNSNLMSGSGMMNYIDSCVKPGKTYTWILSATNYSGMMNQIVGHVSIHVGRSAIPLSLAPARPNPAHTSVQFAASIAAGMNARLEVRDLAGKLVRIIHPDPTTNGKAIITWDLCNEKGQAVANGIYVISLIGDSKNATQRVVVAR